MTSACGPSTVPAWAGALHDAGELAATWERAFRAVPRDRFLPDLVWPLEPDSGEYYVVDRVEDPRAWRRWASADVPIVTQWDDGTHTGREPGGVPTSSSSAPTLVAGMLQDLDVHPGHRVLDVGIGTGWTTALLAARVGPENVAGIELDREVAEAARRRLRDAGYEPQIVIGDGGAGWASGAPYDRVHVTFAVRQVPQPWIEQTRPGGLILAPWVTWFANGGAVARMTVAADNATASGRFTRPAEFMLDRGHRGAWPVHTDYVPAGEWPAETIESSTTLRPDDLWGSPHGVAEFVVGLLVPQVVHTVSTRDDGSLVAWFYSLTCRSWAVLAGHPGSREPLEVYQGGHRRVWDEIEAAYRWWENKDRPGHRRFGLTAGTGGCTIWLDEPSQPVPRLA